MRKRRSAADRVEEKVAGKSFGVTINFRRKADIDFIVKAVRESDPKAQKLPEADCLERAIQLIVGNFCQLGNRDEVLSDLLWVKAKGRLEP